MDSTEIQTEIWNQRITVSINLSNQVESKMCLPYIALLPRVSYLVLLKKELLSHFFHSIREDKLKEYSKQMWLEWKGRAIRWDYPTGLLHDLYGGSTVWSLRLHVEVVVSEYSRTTHWPT
ncbi:autophagy protein 5-like [Octopus sinensis]|uniref:Autophagy protein 5-like n=1 Tax=Octopus sinensis TaxID=2607531 RepID=A0A6P7TVF3_9MOLL|nr:autophagy protein 5-like [Octopus sinensis]